MRRVSHRIYSYRAHLTDAISLTTKKFQSSPALFSHGSRVSPSRVSHPSKRNYWTLARVDEEVERHTERLQRLLKEQEPVYVLEKEADFLGNPHDSQPVAQAQVMNLASKLACGLELHNRGAWTGYEGIRMAHELALGLRALTDTLPGDIAPLHLGESTPLEAFLKTKDPLTWLRIAKALCLQGGKVMGNLPLLKMDESGHELYHATLEELDRARKSSSRDVKRQYIQNQIAKKILPRLPIDLAYFQAISFLTDYVHIDFECKLPFTPKTFLMLEVQHSDKVRATKYLVLKQTLMQIGGPYAGVRVRLFEGQKEDGSPSGLYVTSSMGTNSDGPNRDVVMKQLGISTGSGADADPKGIAYTAFQDAKPHVAKMILSIPKDAVIVNLGHSLGATVATRNYILQKELGYEDSYLCGFNGGALDDNVSYPIQLDAQRRAILNFAEGDPVPFGGSHVLPGMMRYYKLNPAGGTLATGQWNPLYGKRTDIIHHGTPNELASVLIGVPPDCSIQLEPQLKKGIARMFNDLFNWLIPDARGWVIQKALKPDPTEAAKVKPEFLVKTYKGARDPNA